MIRLLLVGLLFGIPLFSQAQGVSEKIDAIMQVPPHKAAERAVASGDMKYLLVPDCHEMLNGYPVGPNPTSAPLGKGETKLAGPSCEDLMGSKLFSQVVALRQYAAEYNRHLYNMAAKRSEKK